MEPFAAERVRVTMRHVITLSEMTPAEIERVRAVATSAVTLKAAQVRRIAPTLCGSVTRSSSTMPEVLIVIPVLPLKLADNPLTVTGPVLSMNNPLYVWPIEL